MTDLLFSALKIYAIGACLLIVVSAAFDHFWRTPESLGYLRSSGWGGLFLSALLWPLQLALTIFLLRQRKNS